MNVLFARVGYMTHYAGPQPGDEKPIGGGAYNKDEIGHEAYNFQDVAGRTYGFFQPNMKEPYHINVGRIQKGVKEGSVEDVLVIWFATHPELKRQVVVGWYKNATVFRERQSGKGMRTRIERDYNIVAKTSDSVLLPVKNRTMTIGHGVPKLKSDKPGQSNAFYLLNAKGEEKDLSGRTMQWVDQVIDYVTSYRGPKVNGGNDHDPKLSFSQFCASLGCPLRNNRWSWSAISEERRRAVFTIWEDLLVQGRYVLAAPTDKRTNGSLEIRRICERVLEGGIEALGIRCVAEDITASPRQRKSFNTQKLQVLRLVREGDEFVAYFAGAADVGIARQVAVGIVPASENSNDNSAEDDLGAPPPGNQLPTQKPAAGGMVFARDNKVRAHVLKRAKGKCEYCGEWGFLMGKGKRYLEAHHILSLANKGPDTVDNVIALCSTDHSKAHYAVDRQKIEKKMLAIVKRKNQ